MQPSEEILRQQPQIRFRNLPSIADISKPGKGLESPNDLNLMAFVAHTFSFFIFCKGIILL